MITENDLRAAIAECQGERNPNANTCMKLAAYYTILNEIQGKPAMEYSSAPAPPETVDYYSETEFGQTIQGKGLSQVLALIDELMTTVEVINRRLYLGVMRRLEEIP